MKMQLDGFAGIKNVTASELTSTLGHIIEQAVKDNPDATTNEIMERVLGGLCSFTTIFATRDNINAFIIGCKGEKQS